MTNRQNVSARTKAALNRSETKEKLRNRPIRRGFKLSEETKQKIRTTLKARNV